LLEQEDQEKLEHFFYFQVFFYFFVIFFIFFILSQKTSLINSLRSNQKGVEWNEPETKALSIEEWVLTKNEFVEQENDSSDDDFYQNINFDYEEKDLIRFTIWDFDERSFFAPLFVTDRSIFVYVWNMKVDVNFENFNYWMQIIKWKAPNSPILVVGTHCDVQCFNNDQLRDYQQYYPIKKFFQISSKRGNKKKIKKIKK
jgi:GTPase SAR1 family protein